MAGEMNNTYNTNCPKFVTETGDNIIYPFSPPIFQSQVDNNFIQDLIQEGSKLTVEKDDWRDKLAGNMKYGGSYIYKEDFILKTQSYLLSYVERFLGGIADNLGDKQLGSFLDVQVDRRQRKDGAVKLDTMWINYQNKHDFNPPHTHRGSLSFVIYCKVPQKIFEEQAVSNSQHAGKIVFQYGEQSTPLMANQYPVTPYEGLIFIFPANMNHYVPSFWTEEERITVAGNFVVV